MTLALVVNVSAVVAEMQDSPVRVRRVVSAATYSRVLDIVFPRQEPKPSSTLFSIVLRFRPDNQPESQIIIRRRADGAQAIESIVANGNAFAKLNEYLETRQEDVIEMAKVINVRSRQLQISEPQVRQWTNAFFETLTNSNKSLIQQAREDEKTGSLSIFLHGTTYELWYEHGLNSMSMNLYDFDVNDSRSSPMFALTRWMNSLKAELAGLK